MALTFVQMWSEVKESVPQLSQFLAQRFVNRAYRDVRESRFWSFLVGETSLNIPDEITTGTASVTQDSEIVVFSVSARAVLDVVGADIPLSQRQFRVEGGPLYQISAYDPAGDVSTFSWNVSSTPGAALLERAYREVTSSAATYSIFRAYFSPPSDFLTWITVKDIVNSWTIVGPRRPVLTSEELDRMDPARVSQGNPEYMAGHKADEDGNPLFELWPSPIVANSLVAKYRGRGEDLSGTDTLPSAIPEQLILERALMYGSEWANKNRGRYAELKGIDWLGDAREHERRFNDQLQRIKMQDEESFITSISYAPGFEQTRIKGIRLDQE